MPNSIYPPETVDAVLQSLDALEVLRLIDYRQDRIECAKPFEYRCFCPIHKENIFRTLSVNDDEKSFVCTYNFCEGAKGGDLISLFALTQDIEYDEALRRLGATFAPHVQLVDHDMQTRKLLEVARNYLELNVIDEAVAAYRQILTESPFEPSAHEGLAQAYAMRGDREELKSELEILLDIYLGEGRQQEVVRIASRLVEIAPNDWDNYLHLIHAHNALGQLDQATACRGRYARALFQAERQEDAMREYAALEREGVSDPQFLIESIDCAIQSGGAEEAVKKAQNRLIDFKDAGLATAYRDLLMLLLFHGVAGEAERAAVYDEIQKSGLSSDEIGYATHGAHRFFERGQPEIAREILAKLDRRARGNVTYQMRKSDLLRALGDEGEAAAVELEIVDRMIYDGQLEEARARLDEILAVDSTSVPALRRGIEIHEAAGDTALAVEACRHAIARLREAGKQDEAIPLFEKLTALLPENADLRAEFIGALGAAGRHREAGLTAIMFVEELIEVGRVEEAFKRLEEFSKRLPKSMEVRSKFADVLIERNETDRAAKILLEAACLAKEKGDLKGARAFLSRASRATPENTDLERQLAEQLLESGEADLALEMYKKMVENLMTAGEWDAAQEAMSKAFQISPEDTGSLRIMATILGESRDVRGQLSMLVRLAESCAKSRAFERVLSVTRDILRIEPTHSRARRLKIQACREVNKIAEALGELTRLGEQLDDEGDLDGAIACYAEILELDPMNLGIRERLFALYLRGKKYDFAVEEGLAAVEANRRLEFFDRAAEIVEQLIEVLPQDLEVRRAAYELSRASGQGEDLPGRAKALLTLYEERDRHDDVIRVYRDLLEDDPHNVDHRRGLVEALRRSGDAREALVQCLALARDLRAEEKFTEASDCYGAVLKDDPSNESALLEQAEVQGKLGETKAAIESFERLIHNYQEAGRDDEALQIIERALKVDPRNVELRRRGIEMALEGQKIDEAVANYLQLYEVFKVDQRRTQALEAIEEAIGVKPDNPQLRRYRIEELRAVGREADAAAEEVALVKLLADLGSDADARGLLDELEGRENPPATVADARIHIEESDEDTEKAAKKASKKRPSTGKGIPIIEMVGGRRETDSFRRLGAERPRAELATMASFTFDNFVIGDANEFAYATCRAVAKAPAQEYNPLFLWGEVGLGKTHLMNAIAHQYIENNPDLSVTYTSTDEFVSRLVEAIQSNAITAFRDLFRSTDMLLIDDIQFLSGKERAQEEFFHIFNVLFQSQRQIVLTSDRPPKSIAHLEDRLVSRFAAGVIVDVKMPGVETRMAIVSREVKRRGMEVDHAVLELIVERVEGSVRELKGATNQVCAMAEIGGQTVTPEVARKVLDTLYAPA